MSGDTGQIPRLGVNIDHVATIRNARGGRHPDPLRAAQLAVDAGADGITAHLREDRRHIGDDDIDRLRHAIPVPLNLEMAATPEMLQIACRHRPAACCIVPEKRQEITTEGGLDVSSHASALRPFVRELRKNGIRVSMFIDPVLQQVEASADVGADIVEFHTGRYCELHRLGSEIARQEEFHELRSACEFAYTVGLEVHAGHGISFDTVSPIATLPHVRELNIGHFLIGEAIYVGLEAAVRKMKDLIRTAHHGASDEAFATEGCEE